MLAPQVISLWMSQTSQSSFSSHFIILNSTLYRLLFCLLMLEIYSTEEVIVCDCWRKEK